MTKKKPKPKRMTAAEKKWNKEFREQMRAEGILPPKKQPLNRKKFLQEVFEQWEQSEGTPLFSLPRAIGWMVSKEQRTITPEEVGVLKVMKLALEIEAFEARLQAEGKTSYNAIEFYEQVIKPVKDL